MSVNSLKKYVKFISKEYHFPSYISPLKSSLRRMNMHGYIHTNIWYSPLTDSLN